jgi:rod shape-determining protein MreC
MFFLGWFFALFTKGRGIVALLLCSIISLSLLFSDSKEKQSFYEVVTTTVLASVQSLLNIKQEYFRVYSENRELRHQNVLLKIENDTFRQSKLQNERLRAMLLFKDKKEYNLIAGEVVARNPRRNENMWIINLGTLDSVGKDMPVLTPKGVVGKIAKVFPNYSLVELLHSPSYKVSIISQKSQSIGILSHYGEKKLVARFPAHSGVQVGDTLVTSGFGGVFPKGLAVGVVKENQLEEDEILQSVEVVPFQKSNQVEEVFIYQKQASWVIDL